ncbi:MAG: hypothetical protein ACI4J0_12310 [Huintestinicola sp.]|uniref:hypothetical protein n=1 Tax=Huintestinicola sp. TaxID=2981661 RepID=UPI003F0821C8
MTSFENIYHTEKYQKHRQQYIDKIFLPRNKREREKLPLEAGFSLESTEYSVFEKDSKYPSLTAYEQSLVSPDKSVVLRWQLCDDHDFTSFTRIFTHSDGRLYLIYKEDLYGYSVLRLSDRKALHYVPKGYYPHNGEEPPYPGESFIMTDLHYCPENNFAAAGGCFWAAPYDTAILDFSDPLSPPDKIITIHDIIDPSHENDELEDIDFKEWKDGHLILEADMIKEQFRFSAADLRRFMSM